MLAPASSSFKPRFTAGPRPGSCVRRASCNPAESRPRQQAVATLDDAVTRLRAISAGEAGDILGDNLRFRLARALADRAELEPGDTAPRRAQLAEALDCLASRSPSLA